jgi:hypothetical protein
VERNVLLRNRTPPASFLPGQIDRILGTLVFGFQQTPYMKPP